MASWLVICFCAGWSHFLLNASLDFGIWCRVLNFRRDNAVLGYFQHHQKGVIMFELSHRTATELLPVNITATKCVDGWMTADWSKLFLRKELTLGNDIPKSFGRLLRQLVFGYNCWSRRLTGERYPWSWTNSLTFKLMISHKDNPHNANVKALVICCAIFYTNMLI